MVDQFLGEPVLLLCLRSFLALLFASAAVPKLQHLDEFEGVVRNFRLVPQAAAKPLALAVPLAELAIAAGLLLWPVAVAAALAAAALLVVFALALAINVARGRTYIDCGCMRDGLRQPLSGWLVLRNVLLALAALLVAAKLPEVRPAAAVEIAAGVAAGATAMLLYLAGSVLAGLPAAARRTSRRLAGNH